MRRKKTKGVLKSGKIYSAQAYLELVLGECYILDCLKPLLPQIERALYLNRNRMAVLSSKKRQRRFHIREIMYL